MKKQIPVNTNVKNIVNNKSLPEGEGAHYFKGEKASKAARKEWGKELFMAEVARVNSEMGTMDVKVQGSTQILTDISMWTGYVGPAGFAGICPEIGALVVLIRSEMGPIPLYFFVPQPEFAYGCELLSLYPKEVSDDILETNRIQPAKLRRLRPGEGRWASAQGSELFLDEGAELSDSMGNSIRLRPDGSAISTSQQNYVFANGIWRSAGPIQRNSLDFETFGERDPSLEATRVMHADGTSSVYIGGKYAYKGRVYNEYRLEVEDSNILDKIVNDVNEGIETSVRTPSTIFLLANMVGNNPNDIKTYGKFLAPAFLKDIKGTGSLQFDALTPSGDEDTLGRRGVAWAFHIPDKGFFGQDKEGALHTYLGVSRSGTPGLSHFLVARGGKREEWGASLDKGLSWDTYCKGAVRWDIGGSLENPSKNTVSRSMFLRLQNGSYTEYGFDSSWDENVLVALDGSPLNFSARSKYKKIDRVAGHTREEVSSNVEKDIGGNLVEQIGASRKVSVGGSSEEATIGDKSINTAGSFAVNALNEIKIQTAKRTEKIVKGSDEKKILLGDDSTEILKGNHTTVVLAGNIERSVVAGKIEDKVTAGSYDVNISAGNYGVSVGAGNIAMQTKAGTVTLGGTQVSIKALVSADINAPLVGLGDVATRSGVITFLSHKDYMTGAPLIPSFKVKAGL